MSGSYAKSKKCLAAMQCGCKERSELTSLMTDLVTTWIGAGLPRDHQAGAALARGRGHGGGDAEGTVRSG